MSAIYLPVGTPLWRDAGAKVARVPGTANAVAPVFVGVTVRDGEALAGAIGVTSLGRGGVILARVQGPVAMDAVVGRVATVGATTVADRLMVGGLPAVGTVLKAITAAVVELVPVRVGAVGTTSLLPFQIMLSPPDPSFTGTVEEIAAQHAEFDWRTFRVRNGRVGLAMVDNTDGVSYPDSDPAPVFADAFQDEDGTASSGGGYDFTVDMAAHIFVWIDADGTPLNICMSATPPVAGWSSTTGWDTGQYILLGWINTATNPAHLRQLVRADLPEYFETTVCIGGVDYTIRFPARIVGA